MAAAGLIKPPLAGSQVSAIRRTRQAAIGRQPGQRDQAHPRVDHFRQRRGADAAVLGAGNLFNACAGKVRRALHGGEIAGPFLTPDQDTVTAPQGR
jgi:hypothetical protein